mmetsp:Transcript_17658/g.57288  ORF Transcript_17658/g.57288 Transcript_17658/m.57288 type:complete len:119 (-) Transcript_17658:1061-1417(-)
MCPDKAKSMEIMCQQWRRHLERHARTASECNFWCNSSWNESLDRLHHDQQQMFFLLFPFCGASALDAVACELPSQLSEPSSLEFAPPPPSPVTLSSSQGQGHQRQPPPELLPCKPRDC